VRAGMVEKAATIHLATKNFAAAAPLMARVTSAKLQLAYARAKEAQGRWQEAAAAYEAGGELKQWWTLQLCRRDIIVDGGVDLRPADPEGSNCHHMLSEHNHR
jgi:hypothetical protein